MSNDLLIILGIASAAAVASPLGGVAAIALRPSSLVLSVTVGFAAGVLMGTFAFEMMPTSVKLAGLPLAVAGFLLGLALVYILDLYVNRWKWPGGKPGAGGMFYLTITDLVPEAESPVPAILGDRQRRRLPARHGPCGDELTEPRLENCPPVQTIARSHPP